MKKMVLAFLLLLLSMPAAWSQTATLEPTLQLRTIDGVAVPFQYQQPMPGFEKQQRAMLPLAGTWRKQRFAANHAYTLNRRTSNAMTNLLTEAAGREGREYDDSAWPQITLPAIENKLEGYESRPEYYEDGVWYRRHFAAPDSFSGRAVQLIFYSVNYVADVWLNGQYLGYHEGGYTPFAFDVSKVLTYGGDNTLAVRVDNPAWGTRNDIVPYVEVDWFNYTGIIHDLYLEASDPLHVVRSQVVPRSTSGNLTVRTVIQNAAPQQQDAEIALEIFNAAVTTANRGSEQAADLIGTGAAVSGATTTTLALPGDSCRVWQTDLIITNPALWSPKTPNLYILRVTVRQQGQIVDRYHSQFGIRTVAVDSNKVLLNNKPVFYTGVARHEDHPFYGRSMPAAEILKDMLKIKELPLQFVRTAHYPNHPATYLYADRLGLAVMEEIPVWWFDDATAWNIHNVLRRIHEQMWREMIFRDYNRPSIILWSTCNECRDVVNRATFIRRVHNDLDTLYPDGRLVSQSAAADRPGANDASQAECDVAGWTMYFGTFHGGTYGTGTTSFLNKVAAAWPGKPVICTEYGLWSGETGSNESTQLKAFRDTFTALSAQAAVAPLGVVKPNGFLMAATWWCAFDWYTDTQPNGYQSMGLFHMDRVTKKQVTQPLITAYLPYGVTGGTTAVGLDPGESALPQRLALAANYPNPFNSRTVISFELPQAAPLRIEIVNLRGQVVETIFDGLHPAGRYEKIWESRSAASGIYLARLRSGEQALCMKMTLIK